MVDMSYVYGRYVILLQAQTFLVMYKTHCQRLLDSVINTNFKEVRCSLSLSLSLSLSVCVCVCVCVWKQKRKSGVIITPSEGFIRCFIRDTLAEKCLDQTDGQAIRQWVNLADGQSDKQKNYQTDSLTDCLTECFWCYKIKPRNNLCMSACLQHIEHFRRSH